MSWVAVKDATKALIKDIAKDLALTINTSIESAITIHISQAVADHSGKFPRRIAVDVTSTGGHVQALPPGYVHRSTVVQVIEFPVSSSQGYRQQLDERSWSFETIPGQEAPSLRFATPPTDGETFRLHLDVPHILTSGPPPVSTLGVREESAVAFLAASKANLALANRYSQEQSPSLRLDSADHEGKSERYETRAKDLRREYRDMVGLPAEDGVPLGAGVFVNLDLGSGRGRYADLLYHRRTFR